MVLMEGKQIKYQGYIYTIYSLVRSATDNPGIVLLSIVENTDMLYWMKSLYIRRLGGEAFEPEMLLDTEPDQELRDEKNEMKIPYE